MYFLFDEWQDQCSIQPHAGYLRLQLHRSDWGVLSATTTHRLRDHCGSITCLTLDLRKGFARATAMDLALGFQKEIDWGTAMPMDFRKGMPMDFQKGMQMGWGIAMPMDFRKGMQMGWGIAVPMDFRKGMQMPMDFRKGVEMGWGMVMERLRAEKQGRICYFACLREQFRMGMQTLPSWGHRRNGCVTLAVLGRNQKQRHGEKWDLWPNDRYLWPNDRYLWPNDRNLWPNDGSVRPNDRYLWPNDSRKPNAVLQDKLRQRNCCCTEGKNRNGCVPSTGTEHQWPCTPEIAIHCALT